MSADENERMVAGMGRCDDGQIHGFDAVDDGMLAEAPMCGAPVKHVDAGDVETDVCTRCILLMCATLGIDPNDAAKHFGIAYGKA